MEIDLVFLTGIIYISILIILGIASSIKTKSWAGIASIIFMSIIPYLLGLFSKYG